MHAMKILNLLTLSALILVLAACGGTASGDGAQEGDGSTSRPSAATDPVKKQPGQEPTKPADGDALAEMRRGIKALEARAEHTAPSIKVKHILVGFQGAPRLQGVTRSLAEAEQLAAELCERIRKGEDFGALMADYSDDSGPGTYPMTTASRSGMVPGFGNVGWRLEVGEVGVSPHDKVKSPFGWHIIKRVE
jgi:hypothetical protein